MELVVVQLLCVLITVLDKAHVSVARVFAILDLMETIARAQQPIVSAKMDVTDEALVNATNVFAILDLKELIAAALLVQRTAALFAMVLEHAIAMEIARVLQTILAQLVNTSASMMLAECVMAMDTRVLDVITWPIQEKF